MFGATAHTGMSPEGGERAPFLYLFHVKTELSMTLKYQMGLLIPFAVLSTAAYADNQPEQKLGLWQRTSQTTEDGKTKSPEKSQHCVDAATNAMVKRVTADAAKQCSRYDLRQIGGKWVLDSVCNLGATTLTLHQETLMSGENAYHSESQSTYSPALSGGGHSRTIADGVWLGPCKGK
jgi:hypothetical protein